MSTFDQCFVIVVGTEGGYTANPADPGNWTGGAVDSGECRGTKYGISAAAYPDKDIANLTADQAKAVYFTDYWTRIAGDQLVPPLALLAFDAAVNNGVGRSAEWVQAAAGVIQDGVIGPETMRALREAGTLRGWPDVCAEVLARRIAFMGALPTWPTFGLGWSRRLAKLPWQAMGMGTS